MDFWPFNFFSAAHELIVQLVKFSDCWVAHSRTDSFSHVFEPSSWSCVVAIKAMEIQTKGASPGIHASLLCCVCVWKIRFLFERCSCHFDMESANTWSGGSQSSSASRALAHLYKSTGTFQAANLQWIEVFKGHVTISGAGYK